MTALVLGETLEALKEAREELRRATRMCGDRDTRDFLASCAARLDRMVNEESEALAAVRQ